MKLLGRFGESYYVRFVVILLIAAPSSVSLPTLLPAGKFKGGILGLFSPSNGSVIYGSYI